MVAFVIVSLFLGRMDTKLGMRREEMRNQAAENPITMEILNSLREIKEIQKQIIEEQNDLSKSGNS